MTKYRVQYRDGYAHADGGDHETLEAQGFRLEGDGMWVDFYDADDAVFLRVKAEDVARIELGATAEPQARQETFDPLDEELAG